MGIFWGFRYVRVDNGKSKIVGLVAMALSVATIIIAVQYTISLVDTINSQMGKQFQGIEGF